LVKRDLALGYITEGAARDIYGLDDSTIQQVIAARAKGEIAG
jgi:hypothetical protein